MRLQERDDRRWRAERERLLRRARLLDILRESDVPALVNDAEGRLVFWNRAAGALFRRSAATALAGHSTILKFGGRRAGGSFFVHFLEPARAVRRSPGLPGLRAEESTGNGHGDEADGPPSEELTGREAEVLAWISAGLQNKEIAQELRISPATVRNHVHNILEKLGVHSKLEAASLAFRRGWMTSANVPPLPRPRGPIGFRSRLGSNGGNGSTSTRSEG